MCVKNGRGWTPCAEYIELRDQADQEWSEVETLEGVRGAWGRFGGLVTLHRYGPDHFKNIRKRRTHY